MSRGIDDRRDFVARALELGRKQGASAVSVLAGERSSRSVGFSAGRLKECGYSSSEFFEVNLVINGRSGAVSGNVPEALPELVARAAVFARNGAIAHFEKYPAPAAEYPGISRDSDTVNELTDERLICDCSKLVDGMRRLDEDLITEAGGSVVRSSVILATDGGTWLENSRSNWRLDAGFQKTTGTDMLFAGSGRSWGELNGFYDIPAILEEIKFDYEHGVKTENISSGDVTLIVPPELMKRFLTPLELAVNGRRVFKGVSPLKGHLGERCFSPDFTVLDNPHVDFAPWSAVVDSAGVPTEKRHLVKDGVLECFLYDYDSAGLAGAVPTGNEGCSPYSMIVKPGKYSFKELLKGVKHGIFVRDFLGFGQSNMDNGDFSANLALAFLVEDGEIQGRVKNAMVAGNLFELLKGNVAFSSDLHQWNFQPYGFFPMVSMKA